MLIRFWGTRGSYPTPGRHTAVFGGNTPCTEIRSDQDELLILDAGTGIIELGAALMKEAFGEGRGSAHLVLNHYHWDHIQGLPFCPASLAEGNRFDLYAPKLTDEDVETILSRQVRRPYVPPALETPGAQFTFHQMAGGTYALGDFFLSTTALLHPGGSFGYRIESAGKTVVYISDTAPFRGEFASSEGWRVKMQDSLLPLFGRLDAATPRDMEERSAALISFCRDADIVICDAQFTDGEFQGRESWGHSTVADAVHLSLKARPGRLILFHHDPCHHDDRIGAMEEDARRMIRDHRAAIEAMAAREGMTIRW